MITVAHLSDLHATPVRIDRVSQLLNKRLLGWLSWRVRRHKTHRPHVLDALIADLHRAGPDHVVVTGDLTNIACEHEFVGAHDWLSRIGDGRRVSAVPGNHDAYVHVPHAESWALWSEFMDSDPGRDGGVEDGFPTLRIRGSLALVGLSSATPTAPFLASGSLGAEQLEKLEKILGGLADSPLCRIVLIHHPPVAGVTSSRRALSDVEALQGVLRRTGADLVLHGHAHRTLVEAIPGPTGPIPSVGARSSSDVGSKPHKRAQYHLYEIERARGPARFEVTMRVRGFDPETGDFRAEGERLL